MFASTRVTAKVKSSGGAVVHTNQHVNANRFHLAKRHSGSPETAVQTTALLSQGKRMWGRNGAEVLPVALGRLGLKRPVRAGLFLHQTQGDQKLHVGFCGSRALVWKHRAGTPGAAAPACGAEGSCALTPQGDPPKALLPGFCRLRGVSKIDQSWSEQDLLKLFVY